MANRNPNIEQAKKNLKNANTKAAKEKMVKTRKENVLIRNAIYDELKSKLIADNSKGKAYYSDFIEKFLYIAKKNPESKCGQVVASTIFQQELLQMLDEQHEKEMNKDRDFQRYRLIKELFYEQREVLYEVNHSRRILCCCSRRAGKSDLASDAIDYASIIPNSRIIYINLTFTNAINQIWNNTIERAEKSGLVITSKHKNDGNIEYANGSSVRIMGNPNNAEIEKLRGEMKVSLIIIDEFFHQRNMQYAIDEVISPLMADRQDCTLLCMGTPPRLAKTYGEKCWNEKGWKKFHWTMFENPYMPNPQAYLEDYCTNKGIDIDSPFIQREYYGKMGVYDTEALVFKGRKTFNGLNNTDTITDIAIGVDYGFSDYNAVITVAYNKKMKRSWVIKESKFNRAGVSDIISELKAHYEHAELVMKSNNAPLENIFIYCDTNEEAITTDLRNKYNLPAFNAYKYDKQYAIELLAEELRTGRMLIPVNGILDEEMEQILYKRDEDNDAIIPELDEVIGIHPDAAMALLYASRKVFFDMDYDIDFKQKAPKESEYKLDKTGTIVDINQEENANEFEDGGIIG